MAKRVRIVLGCLTVLVALASCAGQPQPEPQRQATQPTQPTRPAPATTTARPGSPEVYARIARLTDCQELQASFDRAEETSRRPGGPQGTTWSKIGLAYMKAADDRMREVGCY